jgi:hypothetical protein
MNTNEIVDNENKETIKKRQWRLIERVRVWVWGWLQESEDFTHPALALILKIVFPYW